MTLFGQQFTERQQILFRVYLPGRVIGRIDEDRFCFLVNGIGERIEIQLEIRFGGYGL